MGMKKPESPKVEISPMSQQALDEIKSSVKHPVVAPVEHGAGDGCPLCAATGLDNPKEAAANICSTAPDGKQSECLKALEELLEADRPSKTHDAWKQVEGLVGDADLRRKLFVAKHGGDAPYTEP